MSFFEAIVLGIIQGLTEFLPVSSSGHIELAKEILGVNVPNPLLLSVVLHAATALSTIFIFWKDILIIIKGLLKFSWNEETQFAGLIVLSMIPAVFVGLYFEEYIEQFFSGNILLVGAMLLVTGGLLFGADKAIDTKKNVSFKESVIVGIAQAIAILPGISRSGATISTSVLLGVDRSRAARFSFLMVVPLIMGAAVLDLKKYNDIFALENSDIQERVAIIVADLEKNHLISNAEVKSVMMAIEEKEDAWSKAKMALPDLSSTRDVAKMEIELMNDFEANLDRRVKSDTKTNVLNHDLATVRPLVKTSTWKLLVGFAAAFFTGLFACKWMIRLVKKAQLRYFSYYCFVVGVSAVLYGFFNV
jgi:undecaprenyl-diphosphatase